MRGKSFFVKKTFPEQAHQDDTPQQLLRMGKQDMTRVLCACRTNLPGSAAEKLAQRADLESMLNQLEEEPLIFIVFHRLPIPWKGVYKAR